MTTPLAKATENLLSLFGLTAADVTITISVESLLRTLEDAERKTRKVVLNAAMTQVSELLVTTEAADPPLSFDRPESHDQDDEQLLVDRSEVIKIIFDLLHGDQP